MTGRTVRSCELPEGALLGRYVGSGAYVDCYVTDLTGHASHVGFVEAFYTTAVFKVERHLLAWFTSRPSTDTEARGLAAGELDTFAAWRVEERTIDQLLLCDFTHRTRSWLMTVAVEHPGPASTRLFFGSAVVPGGKPAGTARSPMSSALLGFHKIYSRVLLHAAASRLARSRHGAR